MRPYDNARECEGFVRYNTQMPEQKIHRRDFLRMSGVTAGGFLLAACQLADENPVKPVDPSPSVGVVLTPTHVNQQPSLEVRVLASGLEFPEGPAFDPQGDLWCTELLGGNLVRWREGAIERIPVNGRPNGLTFDRQGRAWVCDSGQNAIRRYDPVAETWETLADSLDGQPLQSPNDLGFDPAGNLLFTCPNFADTSPTGYVCCLAPDGTLTRIAEGYYRPNGLDFIDGGKALVVADTFRKILYKGGWDANSRAWVDPLEWAQVGGSEGPDGMVPGQDRLLYVAIYGDGVIRVVDGEGKIQAELAVPGANPTNAAVDPSGKLGLVVTETEKGQLLSLPGIQPGVAIFDGGGAFEEGE
jgi:gluconolactonase